MFRERAQYGINLWWTGGVAEAGEGGEPKKNLCVPDNDATFEVFCLEPTEMPQQQQRERDRWVLALPAAHTMRIPSVICVLGARVQLARFSSMEISCPPAPSSALLCNLRNRVCDMSAICCRSVSIGCSNNLSMQSSFLSLSLCLWLSLSRLAWRLITCLSDEAIDLLWMPLRRTHCCCCCFSSCSSLPAL